MTFLKRLRMLPVVLGVAATLVAIGTSLFGVGQRDPSKLGEPIRPDGGKVVEDLVLNKFSKLPALTYQFRDGEMLFAWQVKPTLAAEPARPRDILVLVDTSASQAGRPLQQARQILSGLTTALSPNDRVSVWLANTPDSTRALTKGFFPPSSEELTDAAVALTEVEYGSGAADLKNAITKATATIAPARGRQQLVLLLGDGDSAFNPISEADRIAIGTQLDNADIGFFSVPLGLKVNPQNLHGLASLTGGSVVRIQEDLANPAKRAEFVARLLISIDTPVVKVDNFKFGAEVAEVYPTKLPPLRADRTTLVMGKLAKASETINVAVKGSVSSRAVALNLSEKLPAPAIDNFFLNMMLDQWRDAPHKDAPAMLQSDRALALASTQVKLYKDEFLVQAVWAITQSQYDDAGKLYEAAKKIDPNDREAIAGIAMVEKLKAGKLTKQELEQKISAKADGLKVAPDAIARVVIQDIGKQDPPAQPPAAGNNPPAVGNPADVLKEAAARRQVEEQRYKVLVDATIRRARQLLKTDPDTAYQDLKRQRDEIAAYDAIGAAVRTQMTGDLEAVMREIFLKGAEVKRQAAAEREAIAKTRQRLNEFDRAQDDEARTKNRIDQFRQLMKQARFELAYQEAQLMIQERVAQGRTIPPTAVASYIIGQQATQLREWKELVRIREDRFLLTMMQTEKSHIPYPDEPPVHFPPAAVWRELTSLRRDAYLNSNLGPAPTQSQLQLKSLIEDQEVQIEGQINDIPLIELLTKLSKQYAVSFVIMEENFKAEQINDIKEKKPNLAATQLRGMKLGTFLDIVLLSMNATYIVRPDYVEITTFNRRLEEKVTRVFPVADLVIPIPSSVNQATLNQNLQFQQSQLAIFGQVIGAANFFGNNGGNNGGFNNGGLNNGGQGGGNGALAMLGAGGGPQMVNQGFGAGGLGVGGGQLGQFGNLGGQFGLQGGDQSQLLLNLIKETVARGEWAQDPNAAAPVDPNAVVEAPLLTANQLNSLGYYPPARALIIRGTSRYHPAASIKLKKAEGMAVVPPNNPRNPKAVAGNDPKVNDPKAAPVVGAQKAGLQNPKVDDVAMRKKLGNDPKQMWNAAIAQTDIDPGLIVASAEFLMEMDEYMHAAEVLKGALRKGLATDDWVHESLAVALAATKQADSAEIERAAVSGIDLDTKDSKAYLKAAKAEAELKNHAQAIAFCKYAAEFAPDQPTAYANALAYAEVGKNIQTDAVVWAAKALMQRDWSTTDGHNYHDQVKARLPKLIENAEKAGQKADSLRKTMTETTQRDLVIELLWQGAADLDLIVAEPNGSICSSTQKRTTGGGVLKCDILEAQGNDRSEQYTAAMAFKGTYKVSVKQAFGKPIGGTATVKVTKFKGTQKESHDLITIDLSGAKTAEVKLEAGSRTELATISKDVESVLQSDEARSEAARGGLSNETSGFGGGFGPLAAGATATSARPSVPVVNELTEKRYAGIGASAADMRASVKVNADRQTMSFHMNPVFGTGKPVAMPKVPLIPGSEAK